MCHGANLIPEGLETGEFQIDSNADINMMKPIYIVAYGRNPKDDGLTEQTPTGLGIIANGIPNGMYYCVVSQNMIQGLLDTINNKGFGDSIISVFSIPVLAVVGFNGWTLDHLIDDNNSFLMWLVSDFKANPQTLNLVARPSSIDGYTPRNKKLLTYPYLYLRF